MSNSVLLTAAGAKECFQSLMENMKTNMKKDGWLMPFFGIIATKTVEEKKLHIPHFFFITPTDNLADLDKDELVGLVKRVAKKVGAIGIIFGSEAWARHCSKEEAEVSSSVADSKDKFEILMAMVEHRSLGRAAFQAKVVRDAVGNVIDIEEFRGEYIVGDNGDSGRFLGLLPNEVDFAHTMSGGEA